jgi:hypothetical protein
MRVSHANYSVWFLTTPVSPNTSAAALLTSQAEHRQVNDINRVQTISRFEQADSAQACMVEVERAADTASTTAEKMRRDTAVPVGVSPAFTGGADRLRVNGSLGEGGV